MQNSRKSSIGMKCGRATLCINSNKIGNTHGTTRGIRSSVANTETLKGCCKYSHVKTFTCCLKSFIAKACPLLSSTSDAGQKDIKGDISGSDGRQVGYSCSWIKGVSGNYKTGGVVTLAPGCLSGTARIFILSENKNKRPFLIHTNEFIAQTQLLIAMVRLSFNVYGVIQAMLTPWKFH